MECEPETVNVALLPFYWLLFCRYSFTFQTYFKCIENCTTTVAFLGVQTNSSVQADPDQHAPNGAAGSYSTQVEISSAYFVHKRLVKPLKGLSLCSTFKLITAVLLSLNFKYFNDWNNNLGKNLEPVT